MVIGRLKSNSISFMNSYLEKDKDIQILGKFYDRQSGLPEVYLVRKMKSQNNWGSSWAAIKHTILEIEDGIGKYKSYNGLSLSFYAQYEREYTWIETKSIQLTPSSAAKISLVKWND